jgi:hypothetical protein
MDQLIELLKQIQELAGVAIEALQGATDGGGDGGAKGGGGGNPPPPDQAGPPPGQ